MARTLPGAHQQTLGTDKGYDTRNSVADIRLAGITPHVAQNIEARRRTAAAQGQWSISGGGGRPVACGGLQPDPPGQPAQPKGADGMKRAARGDRGRFSAQREGQKPKGMVRSADRTSPMAAAIAGGSGTSAAALGWAALSAASWGWPGPASRLSPFFGRWPESRRWTPRSAPACAGCCEPRRSGSGRPGCPGCDRAAADPAGPAGSGTAVIRLTTPSQARLSACSGAKPELRVAQAWGGVSACVEAIRRRSLRLKTNAETAPARGKGPGTSVSTTWI